ncbi:MAG: family transcriptional regulator [Planctomycetaceae bacterium]|nr:family transcriptional regulator [Planctomycetaceae bacterium]
MLGELLKNARLAAKMTQEDLAFKAGVDRSYVSMLERDLKSPTLQMLFRICRVCATRYVQQSERDDGRSQILEIRPK